MNLETIFQLCHLIALPGWLALAAAPLARERMVTVARGAAVALAVAYLVQIFTIAAPVPQMSYTVSGIAAAFAQPGNVMIGWTHYLAFDLFVGSWEAEDAGRRGVPHWLVLPCLFLTLMLGPIGLLAYFIARTASARTRKAPA